MKQQQQIRSFLIREFGEDGGSALFSLQESGKDYYDITIQKCLWHTACVENGC